MGVVHACVGAGVGSLLRGRAKAFVAGVASHVIADALPHKDCSPWIDVPLTAAALGAVAAWKGTQSPELWGAVGGVAPDLEHALVVAGVIEPEQEIFPTHAWSGALHGRETEGGWSQLACALAAVLLLVKGGATSR